MLLNEVVYDSAGSPDRESFVELYGPAGLNLAGFKLVGVNGNGGAAYNEIALVGSIGADGYFVVAHASGSAALKAQAGQLDAKVDYQNGPDSLQLRWGATVVDALGYGTFAASDVFAGEGRAVKGVAVGHSLGRSAQHTDTDDNSLDFREFAGPTPGAANGACGNGVVDPGETCDGNCPASCGDANACTTDTMTGSAATCDAACTHQAITQCSASDGCCAPGCNATTDSDCAPVCDNGVVEAPETCDRNCPTTCADQDACTTDTLTGGASTCDAACTHSPITGCVGGDGCCPAGCVSSTDADCPPPVAVDDPFDPASCTGPAMTVTQARARLAIASRTVLGTAVIRSRTRTCTAGQCGAWGLADDYVRTLVTYSGGVTTRSKVFRFITDLVLSTTLPGGLGYSVREAGDDNHAPTADSHGIVFAAAPLPATTTSSTLSLWDPSPLGQYDYQDFSVPLGSASLQLLVTGTCARWSGLSSSGQQELAALYRF